MHVLPGTKSNRLTYAFSAVLIAIIAIAALTWDAIPGTYYADRNGFPHGTGTAAYYYENGALMISEQYFRGLVQVVTWYKPDGTVIATETFDKIMGGDGIFLRQDGTVRTSMHYVYEPESNCFTAVEPTIYHDLNGKADPSLKQPIQ